MSVADIELDQMPARGAGVLPLAGFGDETMTDDELGMLEDALNASHGLSPKEIDFIEDLENSWRTREISPKQASWLKDIADRAVETI